MWDYALLSKMAKKFGGPAAFVTVVFTAGRIYERRDDITDLGKKIITSIKSKVISLNNDKRKIEDFKKQLIEGIEEYEKKEIYDDKV